MISFKFLYRKFKRLKYLSKLLKRSPAEAKLDRLWGFSLKDDFPKKNKKTKSVIKEKKDPLEFLDKKFEDSKQSLTSPEPTISTTNSNEDDPNYKYIDQKEFFKETVKDLRKLVYPHLDPITKRHFNDMKLIALGGKVAHNRKMPYKEFLQRQKALKRHLEKNKKLENELGIKFTLDTKGGARFAEIQKRKEVRERRKRRPLFDIRERNGVYRIKI